MLCEICLLYTSSPVSFPDILKKAQDLGYAEADPSADIDGDDIRRKLAISANVAFDALIDEEAIPTFGLRTVTDGDIAAFQRRGFVSKLLAAAQLSKEGICAWIEPTLVESHALEAAVPQNFNLITYYGESIGRQSFLDVYKRQEHGPAHHTDDAELHEHRGKHILIHEGILLVADHLFGVGSVTIAEQLAPLPLFKQRLLLRAAQVVGECGALGILELIFELHRLAPHILHVQPLRLRLTDLLHQLVILILQRHGLPR